MWNGWNNTIYTPFQQDWTVYPNRQYVRAFVCHEMYATAQTWYTMRPWLALITTAQNQTAGLLWTNCSILISPICAHICTLTMYIRQPIFTKSWTSWTFIFKVKDSNRIHWKDHTSTQVFISMKETERTNYTIRYFVKGVRKYPSRRYQENLSNNSRSSFSRHGGI